MGQFLIPPPHIHRQDVADLVCKSLVSGETRQKILSAIDPSLSVAGGAGAGKEVAAFVL
jgi:hypothetical protein